VIRKLFNIIIFASFVFLAYTLWKNQYLEVPQIVSYEKLIISLILLFAGIILHATQWFLILKVFNYRIKWNESVISYGLSVFSKYIPGKVWTHMGRSAYVADKYNYSIKKITALSFLNQLIGVWCGSVIGLIGFLFVPDHFLLIFLFLGLSALIGIFFIYPQLLNKFIIIINKIVPLKQINLNFSKKEKFYKIIPFFFLTLFLYGIAFFFMAGSIINESVDILTFFAFPIGIVIGIITVIFPGGLGVREGSVGSYLIIIGFSKPDSAIIAMFSRLWFLVGEIFIFIVALICKKTKKKDI